MLLEHVSTEGDIIYDRTMFRGSEYLVWLVIAQLKGTPSVDKCGTWFVFLDHIFLKFFFDRSGGLFITNDNLMNFIDICPLFQIHSFLPIGAKL